MFYPNQPYLNLPDKPLELPEPQINAFNDQYLPNNFSNTDLNSVTQVPVQEKKIFKIESVKPHIPPVTKAIIKAQQTFSEIPKKIDPYPLLNPALLYSQEKFKNGQVDSSAGVSLSESALLRKSKIERYKAKRNKRNCKKEDLNSKSCKQGKIKRVKNETALQEKTPEINIPSKEIIINTAQKPKSTSNLMGLSKPIFKFIRR